MGDDNSTNQTESGTNYTVSGNYSDHDKAQANCATSEIRSLILASQEEGGDPVRAIMALEKLKADINSIPSSDISNPERKAEADLPETEESAG
ncbi:hypothetical protein CWI84_09585 [Idiomarina tyrosinivorans]|uniref:Uncharacterized protein n=1 Tax=Idiomarina tyrosinivorans TaxID=1445662 RepID=A0A432ZPP6_9GAMM|nr:hypothetical protein [Idiomarina tyrosinivorans]RUO79867.1 hypothetical protein CWI84_09585 [Idiomarina tyrosinivorans]